VLLAADGNRVFPFVLDMKENVVHTDAHDVTLLNMLARWSSKLPPRAPFPPPPNVIQAKIGEAVTEAKDQGNACFRKQDWEGAVKHYTMALAMTTSRPMWEANELISEELSIVLANRSAAYTSAGAYIEALCDADAVVKIRKSWGKGHFRKGKALAGLQRYGEARAAFELGQQFDPDNVEFAKAIAELP